ncbi:MAG: exodeoxyribonuclease V subunit gamma [Persicimonas sp.]
MLKVWYSNQLDRLVDGLVDAVDYERQRSQSSVFERTPVVVPNWNMETYLKFGIARRSGIAAHMQYQQMGDFFASLLPDDGRFRLLSNAALQFLVVDALCDKKLVASAQMKPVRRYLAAAGDDPDALEQRRFQLAAHLSELFDNYGFTRPQMVRAWSEEPLFDGPRWGRIERWQRALWLELFGEGGRIEAVAEEGGTRPILLSQLFEHLDPDELDLPGALHFFTPGHLGLAFEELLGVIGQRTEVYVWAFNPCREYWEDVVTDAQEESELLSSTAVDGGQLMLAVDETFWEPEKFPLPLRLWGRAGRDQMRMLNRLAGHDARMLFSEPITGGAKTTLRQIQQDVLTLEREREEPVADLDDDSIQIFACSGIQRECEAIANEIWALIRGEREIPDDQESEKPLQFNDIAIVVNSDQRAEYQTHLKSVLRDVHDIPFNIVDLDAASNSRLIEAIELLIDLPFGDFKRRELLELLTHPNLVANFPEVEPQTWLDWCDELNILHGADHSDHADTYIEEDLFNWDQGLKRLVLGGFMTGEPSGDTRAFSHGGFDYLPHEYPHGEATSAARLVMCARSLIDDARRCRDGKRTLADWFTLIAELIEDHLAPTGDDEEFELMRCRRLLGELADADLTGREVSYRVAREFVGRTLSSLEGRHGQYLADGVVVSSFLRARPIPFRVVFVAGMGEAYFPSSDGSDPLDLRQAKWQEGDARRRDKDKYAFLQTLMSTRDRLYLSYVSRDSRTGEALEPSSVVRDLQHMLQQSYLGREKAARCVREHPLRRFDEAYFDEDAEEVSSLGPNYHPEARREAAARRLRQSLFEHCRQEGVPFPELDLLEDALDAPNRRRLHQVLGTYDKPAPSDGTDDGADEVSLTFSQLRQFLESPLQASARWVLGLRTEDEDDVLEREDESFESSYVGSLLLARDVFTQAVTESAPREELDFSAIYEEQARYLELKGELPTGPFRTGERTRHLELMRTWRENLGILGVPCDRPLQQKRFGRAQRHAPVDEIWDSLSFDLHLPVPNNPDRTHRTRVELFGESEILDASLATAVTLVSRKRAKGRDFLRGFITHLALVAAGKLEDTASFDLVIVPGRSLANARKLSNYKKTLSPISRDQALAYLELLLTDYLSGVHDHLLPIEAALDYHDPKNEKPFDELVHKRLTSRWSSCSAQYGPVAHPERFPVADNVDELLERRLGPFLSRLDK